MNSDTSSIWFTLVGSLTCSHSASGYDIRALPCGLYAFHTDGSDLQERSSWPDMISASGWYAAPHTSEELMRYAIGTRTVSLAGNRSQRLFA
jgi:hypothetical protein